MVMPWDVRGMVWPAVACTAHERRKTTAALRSYSISSSFGRKITRENKGVSE